MTNKPKVFDCIRFFNELDLLEIRLNVLNDVVDYFVISECNYTISGNEKPLYYLENKDRFKEFEHKIIHHVLEEIPDSFDNYIEKRPYHTEYNKIDVNCGQPFHKIPIRYQRDIFARDCVAYGLINSDVSDDDIIITSDADEIANPLIFENLDWFDSNNLYVCLQRSFFYGLNSLSEETWYGSRVCTWNYLKEKSIDHLRQMRKQSYIIEQGGWHWSFFGNEENFLSKISSYGDYHLNVPEITDNISEKIKNGLDPLNRREFNTVVVPIDDSYPQYIVDNQEKYSDYIRK